MLRYLDYDFDTTDSNQAAKLYFVLDAAGNPIEVSYRPEGSTTTKFYYYVQNLQGDVIALVDSANGNTVVTYTYDAWGNVLSTNGSLATTLGVLNPFRYRGYVYDSETKLYYLQSRYYDPEMGRFINADVFVSTKKTGLGCNMYAYCFNNPINYCDSAGTDAIWIQEEDSASGQGHTGLMVQDDNGNWFFFYWGSTTESEDNPNIPALCLGVENGAYYVPFDGDASRLNLRSAETIVAMVHKISLDHELQDRSSKISHIIYLEGDFSNTHEYLNSLCGLNVECEELYNLILNNCIQKCLYALSLSDGRFTPYRTYQTTCGTDVFLPAVHPNYEFNTIGYRYAG